MYFLLKIGIFHCYLSLPKGKISWEEDQVRPGCDEKIISMMYCPKTARTYGHFVPWHREPKVRGSKRKVICATLDQKMPQRCFPWYVCKMFLHSPDAIGS